MDFVNPFIHWLVSIGRDNTIVIWKLFDGKLMHRDLALNYYLTNQSSLLEGALKSDLLSFSKNENVYQ
jgi:hypothetical protein